MKKLIFYCISFLFSIQVFSQKVIYAETDRENEITFLEMGNDIVALRSSKDEVKVDTVFKYPGAVHMHVKVIDALYKDGIFVCIYQNGYFLAFTNYILKGDRFDPLLGGHLRTLSNETYGNFSLKILNSNKVEYTELGKKYNYLFDYDKKSVELIEE
ncbi:MAG: hypothetical protein R3A50_10330 [Saprospiraceae bacterium]|nr:hypothetical protein [Lewinellaceae bacterium]